MPEIVGRLRTPRLAAAPLSPAAGEMYYDTVLNQLLCWNGTAWVTSTNMNYKGAYAGATNYVDGDVVIYQGVTYMCVRPTTNAPSTAPPPWPAPATDIWHYVGTAGEPVFQNGWVNYATQAPGSFVNCRFRKTSSGLVLLSGLIKSGTAGNVFTLPAGYRPIAICHFPAVSNGLFAYSHVYDNGNVTAFGSSAWHSLDGIYFYAEQ